MCAVTQKFAIVLSGFWGLLMGGLRAVSRPAGVVLPPQCSCCVALGECVTCGMVCREQAGWLVFKLNCWSELPGLSLVSSSTADKESYGSNENRILKSQDATQANTSVFYHIYVCIYISIYIYIWQPNGPDSRQAAARPGSVSKSELGVTISSWLSKTPVNVGFS